MPSNNNMNNKNPSLVPLALQGFNSGPGLYVGELQWWTTDQQLSDLFSNFGKVTHVTIYSEQKNGKSRGYAYLEFATAAEAIAALQMDGQAINDRPCVVHRANPQRMSNIYREDQASQKPRRDEGGMGPMNSNNNMSLNSNMSMNLNRGPPPFQGGGGGGRGGSGGNFRTGSGGGFMPNQPQPPFTNPNPPNPNLNLQHGFQPNSGRLTSCGFFLVSVVSTRSRWIV
jgi:cleavage and polyadenylation specificity factor subunit 6/7